MIKKLGALAVAVAATVAARIVEEQRALAADLP
jgi:hypothetical protein